MKLSLLFFFGILTSQCHSQSGKLLTKEIILLEGSQAWPQISRYNKLTDDYLYLDDLNFYAVTYQSDSNIVSGLVVEPKRDGKFPLVVFNRGGNRDWAKLDLMTVIAATSKVAHSGYLIFASNYRENDEYGGAEIDDVLNLINISNDFEKVDTNRIGMIGWSRGAMMTFLSLKKSKRITTGIMINGAPDLFKVIERRPALDESVFMKYIPDYSTNRENALIERSPYFWPEQLNKTSSIYLISGRQDRFVDYHQSVRMAQKLDSIGYNYKLSLFDTDHSFRGKKEELNRSIIKWLDNKLKYSSSMRVAITIDDVPNSKLFDADKNSRLLNKLDSISVPVAIFINEGLIFKGDTIAHKELLESWISKDFVTCGNHTFGHSRYSESSFEDFTKDIRKGLLLSDSIAEIYNKDVSYFRFPYNDLGKDSLQHMAIKSYLKQNNFITVPFTIESSDWMFNCVYSHYLNSGDRIRAREIGQLYITETLKLFEFYDSLSTTHYQKHSDQIYLCHDNSINRDYLEQLINELKIRQYQFISLDEAMEDDIYKQDDIYLEKWGISWFYRWVKNPKARKNAMRNEPDLEEIYTLYKTILEEKKD
ncbi:MAG: prolyl oligopeptidase family serine peptidase [Crocinitomicaceae bacterium]|nr:prolyl oligopeptidase family serine peptidase [Crocinitomicaceae bacterium]